MTAGSVKIAILRTILEGGMLCAANSWVINMPSNFGGTI